MSANLYMYFEMRETSVARGLFYSSGCQRRSFYQGEIEHDPIGATPRPYFQLMTVRALYK